MIEKKKKQKSQQQKRKQKQRKQDEEERKLSKDAQSRKQADTREGSQEQDKHLKEYETRQDERNDNKRHHVQPKPKFAPKDADESNAPTKGFATKHLPGRGSSGFEFRDQQRWEDKPYQREERDTRRHDQYQAHE